MQILQSYLSGEWQEGKGEGQKIYHAINGEVVSLVNAQGLDFSSAIAYAKDNGKSLRELTFHERAQMIKAIATHLQTNKEKFYQISYQTGATSKDSFIDIEGGIGTMFALSSIAKKNLPNLRYDIEDEPIFLSKEGNFAGQHILTPKEGVAVHINSFNFPCWGMLEKIACNLLAGVPAIVKPASSSAYLTQAIVRSIVEANILPVGALQLICGSVGDTFEHLDFNDMVTFTGSQNTANIIRSNKNLLQNAVPVNVEADSLNCCILGSDVKESDMEFELFIKEVARELSIKAGQRCTCIRRVLVPTNMQDVVIEKLSAQLAKRVIGDPANEAVTVGALIDQSQVADVRAQVEALKQDAKIVYESTKDFTSENPEKGCFFPITLLRSTNPSLESSVHNVEAFGPVSTVVGYSDLDNAVQIIKAGKGSLVSSVFSNNLDELRQWAVSSASCLGRFLMVNRDNGKESTGHGTPMPALIHGGPGRAGGGEELGGIRGVRHYMQRTALQGSPAMLSHISATQE